MVHPRTGFYTFVGINPAAVTSLPEATFSGGNPSQATAFADISGYAAEFGLKNPALELQIEQQNQLGIGGKAFRYQQVYQGIPILAGEIIANYNSRGLLVAMVGEVSPNTDLEGLSTTPVVISAQAAENALEYVAKLTRMPASELSASNPELWIYDPRLLTPEEAPPHLVWRLEVTSGQLLPINYLVLVNASFGGISLTFNQIDTFWGDQSEVGNQADIGLPETGRSAGVNPLLPNHPNPTGVTYNSHSTSSLGGTGSSTMVCNTPPTALMGAGSCDGTGTASRANAAHYFAYNTINYYDTHFHRNSIDDAGMNLISNVEYRESAGTAYANAYWDGTQMVYGDADFYAADDVVGHEMSHGITEHSSQLFYYYESGAINEMFSDIFGEFIDQANGISSTGGTDTPGQKWLMGEDLAIGAMRNMANPPAGNPAQPDRTQSTLYYSVNEAYLDPYGDNGGVHYNSGVGNKAAYLMAEGGSFNGYTITALGNDKTAAIFYETNTTLLTSGADYTMLGAALVQACNNLRTGTNPLGITSSDCTEVDEAVHATEMHLDPVSGVDFRPQATVCPTTGDVPSYLFNDDIEAGMGNFTWGTLVNTSGMPAAYAWQETSMVGLGSYAISGTRSLFGVNHPRLYGTSFSSVVYESYIAMTNAVTLPASSAYYLYFNHSVALEVGGNYDGAVVEYSLDGGTWTDARPLFQAGRDYYGVISSSFGNPLGGRNAFTQTSHGYVSTRYNLSSLAGHTVRFRWVLGADNAGYDLGWFLDDIQIYSCTPSAPEIVVEAPGPTNITDGGTYNMGTTTVGTPIVQTITVRNTGTAMLNLLTNPPTYSTGFTASAFGSTTVAAGGSTTFTLTCPATDPGSPVTGTISFNNNDSNENPFNFTVNCTVTAPEIVVEGPGPAAITDGGTYDLGTTTVGTSITQTITVRNTGTAALTLTNPPTVVGDFAAGDFGATSVAEGGSTTFTLTCSATTAGSPVSGSVSFANNDGDENPFNFTVNCTIVAELTCDNITTAANLDSCIQWANSNPDADTLSLGDNIILSAELTHIT
ncbi:MAG TPA: M4 family metallopeptidase, partial [Aggregatilineaceae bacterium]|nr:M4 family metallopeptidase [Aggregatilineaceae bacterium]